MTTTTRTDLALAACKGMTDEDLKARGETGFKKMIERKRMYAHAARTAAQMVFQRDAEIAKLREENAKLQKNYEALLSLDAPIPDTTQAAEWLSKLGNQGGV